MARSRRCVGIIVVALTVASLAGFAMAISRSQACRINKGGFEEVSQGMTETEVEMVLGAASGEHFTGKVFYRSHAPTAKWWVGEREFRITRKGWISNEAAIWVEFSEEGLVVNKQLDEVRQQDESIWSRLLRSTGWR